MKIQPKHLEQTLTGGLLLMLGCSGAEGVPDPRVDGGTTDSPALPMDGGAPESGTLCAIQRPTLGTMFYEGGSTCVTSDGRQGRGEGSYGCIALTDCFPFCQPAKGDVECLWVSLRNSLGTEQFGARCVYQQCSGANENERCRLPSGGAGVCCSGTCADIDYLNDSKNCGGCGLQCAPGASCVSAYCSLACNEGCGPDPAKDCGSCATGKACQGTLLGSVCLITSCLGLPDGAPCTSDRILGMCCNQECRHVDTDPDNCGGCGVRCCGGSQCSPGSNTGPTGTSSVGVCL